MGPSFITSLGYIVSLSFHNRMPRNEAARIGNLFDYREVLALFELTVEIAGAGAYFRCAEVKIELSIECTECVDWICFVA